DRKSTRLNSSHVSISYAVFCLKKKTVVPDHGRREPSQRWNCGRSLWHPVRSYRCGKADRAKKVSSRLGSTLGYLASRITGTVDDPHIEITLTTILAYGSYLLALHLHLS